MGRVLVVDDDRDMCELFQMALEFEGYSVEWCTAAAEARARVDSEHFDTVVTDLLLRQGESGLDLCRQLLDRHPEVNVIAITGDTESGEDASAAGVHHVLIKPVDVERLVQVIEQPPRDCAEKAPT